MKYEWLDEHLLNKPGVHKDYKVEWSMIRYMVRGKMFVTQGGDNHGKPILTLKLRPEHGAVLRQQYKDIIPGYYMNKEHWNSIYLEGDVPDDVVRQMADEAYELIFAGLTKSAQKEILGESNQA